MTIANERMAADAKVYADLEDARAERDKAQDSLDRVRAAANTLTWRNGYGDAQQIIYRAIAGEAEHWTATILHPEDDS